jgi:predicted phosphodiesterase
MKIAILSDIHGNIVALEAVLKDLREQGGVDHIIVAGEWSHLYPRNAPPCQR